VPITGEFYKWPWRERRHDQSEVGEQDHRGRGGSKGGSKNAAGDHFAKETTGP